MLKTKEDVAAFAKAIAEEVMKGQEPVNPVAVSFEDMVKAMAQLREPVAPAKKIHEEVSIERFLRGLAAGKADPERAARWARKNWGTDDAMTKILEASEDSAGGTLVPTQLSTEVIELLQERAIFRGMGPVTLPMPTGSLQIPKITGGATAAYLGETDNIVISEPETGMVNMTWKKLGVIVPISNDFLRFEAYGADNMIRNDAVGAMATREDQAFIRGDGTLNTPKGVLHYVAAANTFDANATVNLANVTKDVGKALLALRNAHVRMINVGWMWNPRTEFYLRTLRDSNGNFAFKEELDRGMFFGFPFASSTEIPANLNGDESEIYLIDFADCVIGESHILTVDTSTEASYWDGSAWQSAYSKDLTLLRLIASHDLGIRHEESIVVITAVKWVM
jgi:HK97 family phage major capsid protein